MRIWVEPYKPDVIILRSEACEIIDEAAATEWHKQTGTALRKALGTRKAYLLVDLSNMSIKPSAAAFFGPLAKELHAQFAHAVLRFGSPQGMTKTALLTHSILHHYQSNIFADLDAAETAVDQLRREGGSAKHHKN